MAHRRLKRILLAICIFLITCIGVVALMIASVKHHRIMVLAATAEHSTEDRDEIRFVNVYILNNTRDEISFLSTKGVKNMRLSSPVEENIVGEVADITSIGELVTAITVKTSRISGSVTSVMEDSIEIKEYGSLQLSEDFNIFILEDAKEIKNSKEILLGYESVEFILCDDKIQAAIPQKRISDNVRVLLNTTGFESLYHDSVMVCGEEQLTVTYSDGTDFGTGTYDNGTEVVFDNESLPIGKSVTVTCEAGKIGISSIERNGATPYYRGNIIITNTDKGFTIINELPVESYLYGVVPSEMPSSYPAEALKAQAVCARSFVYKQMAGSSYDALGAHIDDSTNCQVYNNQVESESVINAVDETCGEVLMGEGEILKTYYYSTSCGSGAGIDEVWAGDESAFYMSNLYLLENAVSEKTKQVFAVAMDTEFSIDKLEKTPLSDEKAFRDFIDGECITYRFEDITVKETVKTFDSDFPWYRWAMDESCEDYAQVINDRLSGTIDAFGNKIQVWENGTYVEKKISSIGILKDMEVTGRGESGIVTELVITGSEHTIKISYQSAIRQLLAPKGLTVKLSDGTKNQGMSLLPSGFFYVDVVDESVVIRGGGYGHGVGLSQNGAKAMAEAGLSYGEILQNYFPGGNLYNYSSEK